jgi:hypothetical protein
MARRMIRKGSALLEEPTEADRQRLAEMLATHQVPGARGVDRHFWQGFMLNNGFQKGDLCEPEIRAEAKAAGIETAGKIYMGCLARPGMGGGDPLAWVADISDARTSARIQGKNLQGITTFKADLPDKEPEAVRLAPDLIEEMMQRELRKNLEWARDLDGLRQFVIEEYGSKA